MQVRPIIQTGSTWKEISTHTQSLASNEFIRAHRVNLAERHSATHSGFVQLRLLGCFNRWLGRKGLTSEDVDAATVEQYLRGRAQSRKLRKDRKSVV